MKAQLKFGNALYGEDSLPVVTFDSQDLEASRRIFGNWLEHEFRARPSLLKPGVWFSDAGNSYFILNVESPLFDINWYVRENPTGNKRVVWIISAEQVNDQWIYTCKLSEGDTFVLSEDKLLKFLTEHVQLEELMET